MIMANFNEHSLEMSIMELFQDEGYIYLNGEQIHRERSEVLLIDDLRKYLLNRYATEGLTPSEADSIILRLRSISGTIYEANKAVCKMICDGFIFNREDHTKKDLYIELIDFDEPEKNVFKIVNQFEIEGINNQLRIPDGIVFINGIPVVVLEFKSAVKENTTIMDAYTQLTVRYRRDIPELFKYNAFIVISDGANNKYGSFFSPYDFFYAWRKIEADDKELDGINSLVTMVSGLFRKERLLAVIKDFVYFPDSSDKDLKIVCRYPQYFAAVKLFENIKAHLRPEGDGKGGTYFGATGCGKSYTMLFLTRMLMKSTFFHSPTILIITDRTDLDDQLSKQFVASKKYIGDETVVSIDSREKLRQELQGRTSGGVYMTTIQKFTEDLELLTDRANVICISDEAHRSQINLDQKVKVTAEGVERTYGFAKYLHDSLPNATYVGFTGTPVDGTIEVFGPVVDAYTMTEAVKDGITVNLVKDQLDVLAQMFHNFNSTDYFNGSPKEQLACLNRAVEYVQLTEDLETRFMAAVKRMKQAFNLCSSSDAISDREKDYLHFYCAVRSILFKLTKGDAPDISQMNARVRELLEGAIQSDGIEELFETGKHISVDIFSDEYLDKINAIQLPNTKIKVLQRLLSQAIDEYKKVNRIMGMEFSDRLKRVVDEYNNRRRDEAFANEVLDDVAEQLAKLLEELKKEKDSFKGMGIDYEEKAFYDILKAVAKKYEFEYPDDKMIELSKRIKVIVDDKAKYTDWSTRDDIKANLQVDLILLLDEFDYPPVTIDDVYKEVLEQAENFKKYSE